MSAHHKQPSSQGPHFGAVDHSIGLLSGGYDYWESVRQRTGRETVQTRLLHERVTVIRGARAAQFFYEQQDTERSTALPMSLMGALFGRGAVHTLDGEAHAHRKAMFNSHLDAYAVADVVADVAGQWDMAAGSWGREIDIFEEVAQILFRTGARWVGLPDSSAPERAKDMLALVDGFGAPSLRQIRARRARRRTDAWVIDQVRQARSAASDGPSVLEAVAAHRGLDGGLLDEHTAAVEIINLVRPLVAVSWLVSGMALAYDTWPSVRESVLDESVTSMEMAQETRRFHPFVPFLANRPTRDLSWDGVTVPAGTLLAIDVWGTNHDPRTWDAPTAFDPTRFRTTPVTPYNLIPQGGGDRHTGHRCPGEDLTLAVLMTLAPRVAALRGRVVEGRPDLRRMPPRPRCLLRLER